MPRIFRTPPEQRLPYEIERIAKDELKSVILFFISHHLDEIGSDTWKEYALVDHMLKACKDTVPDMLVISYIYFYEYTFHNHCEILGRNCVDNDATLLNLCLQVVVVAQMLVADFIVPSSRWTGRSA